MEDIHFLQHLIDRLLHFKYPDLSNCIYLIYNQIPKTFENVFMEDLLKPLEVNQLLESVWSIFWEKKSFEKLSTLTSNFLSTLQHCQCQ